MWNGKPKALRWLYPGMRVKRYALAAALGFLTGAVGLAGLLPPLDLPPGLAWGLFLGGGLLGVLALRSMNRSILAVLTEPEEVPERVYVRRRLERGPRVVAFGGGTGLSRVLKGFKEHTANLTAIVAVTDDGGSTGKLRTAYGLPAVGDLVDCLAALSDHPALPELLAYRFRRGEFGGHTFGNLFLLTLHEAAGSFAEALRQANAILNLRGQVLPATPEAVRLRARFQDGSEVEGEEALRAKGGRVREVFLVPEPKEVMAEALLAISRAELLVLGPGSLYTSVIPSFLPKPLREAILKSRAPLVYVVNLMTEPGETDGYTAYEHYKAVAYHLGRRPDVVLVHTAPIPEAVRRRYAEEGRYPVAFDPRPFAVDGVRVLTGDFREEGPLAQHDPKKVVQALLGLV
ncbi:putative gluconeogenesis factor [Thermus composti]|uniref:Putative gluconeogenesis factor n=1 Tax=Thermus composti TaxID=532059 RepID=A0ABV6PY66_9DEIN|nr:gluconeogenesis factor YvcK family protein [Thermus composti]GGM92500.1 putative gluconeogenesis factor [Thermus composti]